MSKRPSKEDANQVAARIVAETIAKHTEAVPDGLDAAWEQWSRGVGKIDARGLALLRAAFEAGAVVGGKLADGAKKNH